MLLAACDASFHFDAAGADASSPDAQSSACTDDTSCSAGLHCDLPSATCEACVSDEHCAGVSGRPRCDTALHRCVECGTNQDCGNLSVCENTTHLCVRSCTEDSACTAPAGHCDTVKKRCFECKEKGYEWFGGT